jgi:hypothetical protein
MFARQALPFEPCSQPLYLIFILKKKVLYKIFISKSRPQIFDQGIANLQILKIKVTTDTMSFFFETSFRNN